MSKLLRNQHHLYPLLRCYLVNGQMTFCDYSMTTKSLEDLKNRKQQLHNSSDYCFFQQFLSNMAIQYQTYLLKTKDKAKTKISITTDKKKLHEPSKSKQNKKLLILDTFFAS